MAAFSLTVTGIGSSANIQIINAGASSLVSGRAVTQDGEYVDATDTDALGVLGVTFHPTLAAGKLAIVQSGSIFVSNTLTPGAQVVVSGSTGQLDYADNLVAGERYLIVGYVVADDELVVQIANTGYVKPI